MSLELEDQIRRVADAAFDQTRPVWLDRFGTVPVVESSSSKGRWLLLAAASVVVVVGIGALVLLRDTADDPLPVVDPDVEGTVSPTIATTVSETTNPEPVVAAPDFSEEFSASGLLAEIPLTGFEPSKGLRVAGTDFSVLSAISGIERTASDDPLDPLTPWVDLFVSDRSVALVTPIYLTPALREPAAFEEEIGFGFLDIERFARATGFFSFESAGLAPIDVFTLRSDMAPLVDAAGEDEIVDIGEGQDDAQNEPTLLRPLGSPLRVGVDADASTIAISTSTPLVTAWLAGDSETVAGDADLAAAATVLDKVPDTYTVQFEVLGRDRSSFVPEASEAFSDSDFVITEPFTTTAFGWSGTGNAQRTTIVYVFADEQAAAASVDPIARLFDPDVQTIQRNGETIADVFVLDDVTTDGRAVVVTGNAPPDVFATAVTGFVNTGSPWGSYLEP